MHKRIHLHKKDMIARYGRDRHINLSSERDAIGAVAREISAESKLLCFDEFHVTDIADAMVMSRFFGELWKEGTILVATSNRHPDDLYESGLNRSYFLPFIDMLKKQCVTVSLTSGTDYRMRAETEVGAYYVPHNSENQKLLYTAFLLSSETENSEVTLKNIPVMMGRWVEVRSLGSSCYITFKDMCEADRGPADYHSICQRYNTVFLEGIRQLSLKVHYLFFISPG